METDDAYREFDRRASRVVEECAHIDLDIDPQKEVIDLCKAWKDAAEDAKREGKIEGKREGAILASIRTARRYGATDEGILTDIMEQFELTEEEAKKFMEEKTAEMAL